MIVGFNHNVMYKGEIFHIQTEDSGIRNPHIITLLYQGGTIISSRKTSYADIIKADNLERVVEELMKEQHKDMLRRLKAGEFDARAFGAKSAPAASPAPPVVPPAKVAPPTASPSKAPTRPAEKPSSLDEVILDFLMADEKDK
ncbi:hypothetical protein GURASL_32630 [Geotalea uraniireducens]|uniref:Uncharacterized protein n=1 Tax=Geotalea uraniireducens TaxID=351604 RepID=A0ABM8EQL5_9BACT|nr:hypothetical protein [Geotalea uraniireducens]BDV44340.1 hypothetical protein GURASL_32630 [Geotalea uraniireducens]